MADKFTYEVFQQTLKAGGYNDISGVRRVITKAKSENGWTEALKEKARKEAEAYLPVGKTLRAAKVVKVKAKKVKSAPAEKVAKAKKTKSAEAPIRKPVRPVSDFAEMIRDPVATLTDTAPKDPYILGERTLTAMHLAADSMHKLSTASPELKMDPSVFESLCEGISKSYIAMGGTLDAAVKMGRERSRAIRTNGTAEETTS